MSACVTCGAAPCVNPSFCAACREADRCKACGERPRYIDGWGDRPTNIPHDWDALSIDQLWYLLNRERPTPKTTIDAIMYSVRERGLAALKESANIERLQRCDDAAKSEINRRIARLDAAKEIAA